MKDYKGYSDEELEAEYLRWAGLNKYIAKAVRTEMKRRKLDDIVEKEEVKEEKPKAKAKKSKKKGKK